MDCIIKPSIDIRSVFDRDRHFEYIATSKHPGHFDRCTTLHFYENKNGREGIFARGIMLDFPTMSKHVPSVYQKQLYAKELKQFPLHFTRISSEIYIDKEYLFQFPAMHMYSKTVLAKPDCLYFVFDLEYQLNFIKYKYHQYSTPAKDNYSITDGHYRLWFHELREYLFKRNYRHFAKIKNSCLMCRMKYEPHDESGNGFFEPHEKVDIDFNQKYRRISKGNFIIVCPNCHKKEHENILNSSNEISRETKTFFHLH
jgi:hypothetical protein